MKFIKIYAIILILLVVFVFLGGYMLFDFAKNFWLAVVSCAFLLAVFAYIFMAQEEKIETLEKRIKELEEKSND